MSVLKVNIVNILLSGDNAVVIALACRSLPPRQQKRIIFIGTSIAIIFRIIFTQFAAWILEVPFLKLMGAALLFYIAVKFLLPEIVPSTKISTKVKATSALRKIVIADLIMSLDNILGVAAAANGNSVLLIFGLATSMPIVVYGSFITLKLMRRFHFLPTLGAVFLGYIACEMGMNDIVISNSFGTYSSSIHLVVPILSGIMVVVVARFLILIRKYPQASIFSIDP